VSARHLEAYAKQLVEENNKLKGSVDQSHNTLIQSAKKQVEGELAMAKAQYRQAYESGEPDAILEAQTALNTAQIRMERVNSLKPKENIGLQSRRKLLYNRKYLHPNRKSNGMKEQNHGATITHGSVLMTK
jgi:hypothetical protein